MNRGELEVETLLTIVLVLVVVWLVVEILTEVLGFVVGIFALFRPLLGLLVVAIIVLWLLGRL